jgi:hypothetical protein
VWRNACDQIRPDRTFTHEEAMARHYFGSHNPIGRHIQFRNDPAPGTEIIGVVKDFVAGTPRDLQRRLALTYFSYRDRESSRNIAPMYVAVRLGGAPLAMTARVRYELRAIDPELPILKIYTVDQQLEEVLVKDRMLGGAGPRAGCDGRGAGVPWPVRRDRLYSGAPDK